MRTFVCCCVLSLAVTPAFAQSLYLKDGARAVSAGTAWSVGPSSNGIESGVSIALSRVDLGIGLNHYTYKSDDGFESSWNEYAPFIRVFLVKEQAGAPVSLSVGGQMFFDVYPGDDSGGYVQLSTTLYKSVTLAKNFAIHPFAGFGFVAESYTFGGGDPERAHYLTADFGIHFTTAVDRPWVLQMTLLNQSFRRETYRSARIAVIRAF